MNDARPETLADDPIVIRTPVRVAGVLLLTVCTLAFLVGLSICLLGLGLRIAGDDGPSVGELICFGIAAALPGRAVWQLATRMFSKTPLAVFDGDGFWIQACKEHRWRWEDIDTMYVWDKRAGTTRVRYLSFDPSPSPQVDEMCRRLKRRRRLAGPVPPAARTLSVPFAADRDRVIAFVERVAPQVHIETPSN